jgi:hypothetical protein
VGRSRDPRPCRTIYDLAPTPLSDRERSSRSLAFNTSTFTLLFFGFVMNDSATPLCHGGALALWRLSWRLPRIVAALLLDRPTSPFVLYGFDDHAQRVNESERRVLSCGQQFLGDVHDPCCRI